MAIMRMQTEEKYLETHPDYKRKILIQNNTKRIDIINNDVKEISFLSKKLLGKKVNGSN